MPRALLVHPEFRSASFWNYRDTCQLMDASYPAAPLGLCTVAAMLPSEWELRLVDRNVEPLTDEALDWAARIPGARHGAVEVRAVYVDETEEA